MRAAERGDRLRGRRRPVAQGQAAPGAGLAGAARHRPARRPGPVGPAGAAVRRSRRGAAPAQGPARTRPAATAGRGSSRSPGPAGSARAASPGSSRSTSTAIVETIYWHRGRSPVLRRRHQVLGAGRDGPPARRPGRERRRGNHPRAHRRDGGGVRAGRRRPALDRARSAALLGVEPPPPGGRDVLFAAWRHFFEHVAERGTTVLLFEDLHWADSGLLDFIDHLLDWSKAAPLLVVTLARPELFDRRPDWGAGTPELHRAGPRAAVRRAAMRELLAGLRARPARARASSDRRPRRRHPAVRRRDGPGAGRRRPARASRRRYRPVGELGDLAVPDTLRSLIASRLDALDADDRSAGRRTRPCSARPSPLAALSRRDGRPTRRRRAPAARAGPARAASTSRPTRARRSAASTGSSSR